LLESETNYFFSFPLKEKVGAIEVVIMDKGRDSYPDFLIFQQKNDLALYQTYGYENVLLSLGSSIEQELKQFYEIFLCNAYGYPSLKLNTSSSDNSWLNKCRILFPELDAIVKQYDTYVKEDEFYVEILQLSKPLKMTDGHSLLINKYYSIKEGDNEIWRVLRDLFSSGALLVYVEPYKDKHYYSLIVLLEQESVDYDNYEDYQKQELRYLIEQDILLVDDQGKLIIADIFYVKALKGLWEYHVCSYWHYDIKSLKALDDMLAKGWLEIDDHLLSKPERQYFSYYLDNMEYINGYAYRNHYAHGSTPPVDNGQKHASAYLVFLRLLVILLDDMRLACRALYERAQTM